MIATACVYRFTSYTNLCSPVEEGRTLTFLQRDVAGRSVRAAKINRSPATVRANFRETFEETTLSSSRAPTTTPSNRMNEIISPREIAPFFCPFGNGESEERTPLKNSNIKPGELVLRRLLTALTNSFEPTILGKNFGLRYRV